MAKLNESRKITARACQSRETQKYIRISKWNSKIERTNKEGEVRVLKRLQSIKEITSIGFRWYNGWAIEPKIKSFIIKT